MSCSDHRANNMFCGNDNFPEPTNEIVVTTRSRSVATAHVDSKCEGVLDINTIYLKEYCN